VTDTVECAECATPLDNEPKGAACPKCGSTRREHHTSVSITAKAETSVDMLIVRTWDGSSLTLFGVLYGIVVTVAGVVVAVFWPYWWTVILFAVVSLGLLLVMLVYFGQPVIEAMRWLIERGKRVPPRGFDRRWRSKS
jgi:uncharacterized protein (DUF983 family)